MVADGGNIVHIQTYLVEPDIKQNYLLLFQLLQVPQLVILKT